MKAYVSHDPYMGVDENHSGFSAVKAESEIEILSKVLTIYGYGFDPEEEPESIEKIIDLINESNGDGCDYVISVITEKGKVLFHV
jgi:hypothetical protein